MGRPRNPEPDRYCEQCGTRLERRVSAGGTLEKYQKFIRRRFCNHRCLGDSLRLPPKAFCEQCGQGLKHHQTRFCSHECSIEHRLGPDIQITPAVRAYLAAFDAYVKAWARDDFDGMLEAHRARGHRLNELVNELVEDQVTDVNIQAPPAVARPPKPAPKPNDEEK